jgi:glycosyltransferase involved in cell wall biosynthesis
MSDQIYRILFIAPSFPQIRGAESFVNGKLVLGFLKAGWKVDVITMRTEKRVSSRDNSSLWNQLTNITNSVSSGPSWFEQRLKSFLWCFNAYSKARKLIRKRGYDVVISRSQPVWAHIVAYLVAADTGIKWVSNWNDPSPQRRYPKPYGKGVEALWPAPLEYLFRKLCMGASWHTFPCERLRQYMLQYMPTEISSRSSVIPHISLHQNRKNIARSMSEFALYHIGSVFFRNYKEFLEGLRQFVSREIQESPLSVRFIGWQPDDFLDAVRNHRLQDIVSVERPLQYEDALKIMEAADVLLVIESDTEGGIFFPSKVADYVQTCRPILAISPAKGTLKDLLQECGGGIAVDCKSPGEIAAGLEVLYKSWKKAALDKDFSTRKLYDNFSERTVISLYKDIFQRIGVKPSNREPVSRAESVLDS